MTRQSWPRLVGLLARVAVLVLTATLLYQVDVGAYLAAERGIKLLSQSQSAQQKQLRQYEHIRDELARQVPAGTRMTIGTSDPLWYQRLAEFAVFNRIDLVSNPTQAEVSATVVEDPTSAIGVRLVVERLG